MDPIPFDPYERTWQEVLRLCPPTTPARGAARRKADLSLQDAYPGLYVAYLDNWSGDELERVVVASAAEVRNFHTALRGLSAEIRARVTTTRVPDPNEGIFAGGSGLI
jgi:hypothetical protein